MMNFKIATLNLCLGLPNKKEHVKQLINEESIDILCLQETELEVNLDHNLLSLPDFNYESEQNDRQARVGCYVKSNVVYNRRSDLEGVNSHLIILDVKSKKDMRVINIYRCFNPQNGRNPFDFFKYQISLIRNSYTDNTVLLGDFNLDWNKKGQMSYSFQRYFEHMDEIMSDFNFVQMINFPTWSRLVNGRLRESVLDHVYTSNPTVMCDLYSVQPMFGDHLLLVCVIDSNKPPPASCIKRSWCKYSKEALCDLLARVDWTENADNVQGMWDSFENKLIQVVDTLLPEKNLKRSCNSKKQLPSHIKTKLNKRKKLLQQYKVNKSAETKAQIKILDRVIKSHFSSDKWKLVRREIIPGNSGSLWKAVKIARDVNVTTIPNSLYLEGILVPNSEAPETFASFFNNKIKKVLEEVKIEEDVYNGKKMVHATDKMFMDEKSIKECMLTLKPKNSEGFDRIPQRVLLDGTEHLLQPLTTLFAQIYKQRKIPNQWLVAKTIPIFKNKGEKRNIENYRPIANLCSTSNFFEKLILKRILEVQDENKVDITRQGQHGFKKMRSTSTLSVDLQSIISRALDNSEYVLVSSLDLSSAFDVVNIKLLIKRLKIIGLPNDLIELIKVWLEERSFYVSLDGINSYMFDLLLGTVQGSVLGPVLYAIFVSPLFDITPVLSFADDSYNVRTGVDKKSVIEDMEKSLEAIVKWLKKSGLKVNQEKTDMCLFYKHDTAAVMVNVGGIMIESKKEINVLGVTFDSKMQWSSHVSKVIIKANKALNAIKLIRKFFNKKELLQLLTSNFFSVLYYNSEVWHLGTLKASIKRQLFCASSKAIRVALHYPDPSVSYMELHKISNRATPLMIAKYKLSLLLYKTFNEAIPINEWVALNFNQVNTSRQITFKCEPSNKYVVGKNVPSNRFSELNGMIPLEWLNKSAISFKILCKQKFLTYA